MGQADTGRIRDGVRARAVAAARGGDGPSAADNPYTSSSSNRRPAIGRSRRPAIGRPQRPANGPQQDEAGQEEGEEGTAKGEAPCRKGRVRGDEALFTAGVTAGLTIFFLPSQPRCAGDEAAFRRGAARYRTSAEQPEDSDAKEICRGRSTHYDARASSRSNTSSSSKCGPQRRGRRRR